MATSWIEVVNGALVRLGVPTIISLDDDVKAAQVAKVRLNPCRDTVLRLHPWNCAQKRITLAAETTAPAFGWDASFPLPVDCLRVLRLEGGVPYEIEGRRILADADSIDLVYVAAVDDVTRLDTLCAECIAAYLAADLANTLLQNPELHSRLRAAFDEQFRFAKTVDAQENDLQRLQLDHYERARRRSGVWG
jgi:hypothetical protein